MPTYKNKGDLDAGITFNKTVHREVSIQKVADQIPKLHNIDLISGVIIPNMYILFDLIYFSYFLSKGNRKSH